jgi:transposase
LFGWRRQALRDGGARRAAASTDDPSPRFVPLVMDTAPVASPVAPEGAAAPAVEVRLAGAVVRVAAGMDAGLLTTVLRAVRASASRS